MSSPSACMVAVLSAVFVLGAAGRAHAVEEPAYEVLDSADEVELRRYESHLVAEILVDGEFAAAGNEAFGVLFDYISGANSQQSKIAMTAPVVQEAVPAPAAPPVAVAEPGADGWRVGFVVPSEFDRSDVPRPSDPRVVIREVPKRLVVAVRFTGRWAPERFDERELVARAWSEAHGYRPAGPAVWARYDPPFVPWFLRQNEVLLPVEAVSSGPG